MGVAVYDIVQDVETGILVTYNSQYHMEIMILYDWYLENCNRLSVCCNKGGSEICEDCILAFANS